MGYNWCRCYIKGKIVKGAKTTDEHWIIEDNERHSVDGYSLGSDVETKPQ